MKRWFAAVLILSLALFGLPSVAMAHAVETNYVWGDLLEFQSTFSTGEPLQAAVVQIYAPNDLETPWQELTTDDQGRFAFMPDLTIPGDWNVYIEQDSHKDIWTVPVGANGLEFDNISDRPQATDLWAKVPHLPHGSGLLAAAGAIGMVITVRRWKPLT